jgi:glycerophosphoryl diester phosphodiesterase
MADGLALRVPGHAVRLKWHRLRRALDEPVFMAKRLEEGLALGASLEIDLRLHGGGGFAVLHDEGLERETTGRGPVDRATAADLRSLRMRGRGGEPTDNPVLLLEDVARALRDNAPTQALLQIDLKEVVSRLSDAVVAEFAGLFAGLGQSLTVSGNDWAAVKRLAEGVPGIGIGYDPCELFEAREMHSPADAARLVEVTERIASEADTIYLDYRLIFAAERLDFDIVEAFHRRGRKIDAWTLNTDQPVAAKAGRFARRPDHDGRAARAGDALGRDVAGVPVAPGRHSRTSPALRRATISEPRMIAP